MENGAGHLVESQNAEDLAREMLLALSTSNLNYFNEESAEEVLHIHDEKNITQKLLSIYEDAIKP